MVLIGKHRIHRSLDILYLQTFRNKTEAKASFRHYVQPGRLIFHTSGRNTFVPMVAKDGMYKKSPS